MIREKLIPAFRQRFPNVQVEVGTPPDAVLTILAAHEEVGPVRIYDDDAEATVELGPHTHFHLEPEDRSLSDEAAAQWITDAVLDFLEKLFADRVVIQLSPDGSNGSMELDTPPTAAPDSISQWYVWSGPLSHDGKAVEQQRGGEPGMSTTADDIRYIVETEIARIPQPDLVALIRELAVPIRREQREWDYGNPNDAYPCWIFAEHPESNTAFAYTEHGFGPSSPWGLLFIKGQHMSMGMDSGWYVSLEDLFRESMAWEGTNPPGYSAG